MVDLTNFLVKFLVWQNFCFEHSQSKILMNDGIPKPQRNMFHEKQVEEKRYDNDNELMWNEQKINGDDHKSFVNLREDTMQSEEKQEKDEVISRKNLSIKEEFSLETKNKNIVWEEKHDPKTQRKMQSDCNNMKISASCEQYEFVVWDINGNLVFDSYFDGNVYDDCYDPSLCYVMEFNSQSGECDYEVVTDGDVAYEGTTISSVIKMGCQPICNANEAELILITYVGYYGLSYTIHIDDVDYQGEVKEGDSKIHCLDLEKCNLLAKDKAGYSYYYLYDSQTLEIFDFGDVDVYKTIGNCPMNCDDEAVLIRSKENFNYAYYKDDKLMEQGTLPPSSFSDQLCIDPSSCYILDGEGTATYYFVQDGTDISGKGKNTDFRTFGSCPTICESRPVLSETKRGGEIIAKLASVSGMKELADFNSDRYKAACWIIYDDLRMLDATDDRLIQRYILGLLYITTNGPQWKSNGGFLTGKDECDWEFIPDCDDDLFVKRIFLSDNNLSGTFSREIYSLLSLEIIEIDRNDLYGTIPLGMSRLISLKDLGIGKNQFTGTLPADFMDLPSIDLLYFSENLFSGTIPSSTVNMKNLTEIGVYDNLFTGNFPQWLYEVPTISKISFHRNRFSGTISNKLANLKNLRSVWLAENSFSGNLPADIFTIPALNVMRLEKNNFTGNLPQTISSDNAEKIILSDNFFSGTIPASFADFEKLTSLHLQNNFLSGTFPEELEVLEQLKEMRVENNNVSGTIPFVNCNFTILTSDCSEPMNVDCLCCTSCFGLFTNNLDILPCQSTDIEMFFDSEVNDRLFFQLINTDNQILLEDLTNARTKGVYYNTCASPTDCFILESNADANFTVSINEKPLVEDVGNEGDIYFGFSASGGIEVDKCDSYMVCGTEIPPRSAKRKLFNMITKFSDLENFHSSGSIQETALCWWLQDLDRYEESTLQNTALIQRYLLALVYYATNGNNWYFSQNWLSPEHECNWFGISCEIYPTLVSRISLEGNNLAGSIPKELGELRGLTYLALSNNQLMNGLPIEIIQLTELRELKASDNNLGGPMLDRIELLKNLKTLDISSNRFSSTLPAGLGSLEGLEVMKVNDNSLSGEIPTTLKNLKKLKLLSLSRNLFNGKLNMIKDLSDLEILELSFNYFTGRLPIFGSNQKSLRSLVADNNKFSGSIISEVELLSSLETFVIADNSITGSLPSQLGRLSNVSTLVVSYNSLKGTIPFQLSNIRSLSFLHLQNNALEGDADFFDYEIGSFISDCGRTEVEANLVTCFTCTQCCNTDGDCISSGKSSRFTGSKEQYRSSVFLVLVCILMTFIFSLISFLLNRCSKRLPRLPFIVRRDFNDGSVFRFFLSTDKVAWIIPTISFLWEFWIAWMFTKAGDINEEGNLWEYSEECPSDSFECQDTSIANKHGWISFAGIIAVFLLPDLLNGSLLLYECSLEFDYKGLVASFVLLEITIISIIASTIFIKATSVSNIVIIQDAVIALFLNSIDEQLYLIVYRVAPMWAEAIEDEITDICLKNTNEISEIIDYPLDVKDNPFLDSSSGKDDINMMNLWRDEKEEINYGNKSNIIPNGEILDLEDEGLPFSKVLPEKNNADSSKDSTELLFENMTPMEAYLLDEIKHLKERNAKLEAFVLTYQKTQQSETTQIDETFED